MRWQHVDYHNTQLWEDTRFLIPKRNSLSVRRQFVDYYSTRPMKRQYLYFPRRNHHSRRQRLVDYYGTRTISPFPKKELFIHARTSNSTTMVLEETTQDSQWQASWKGNQPIDRQLKRKKYYTSECQKYSSGHASTQKPKEYYNNCSSLWRRLQATDNPISVGFHLCNILREFLLWAANGHPSPIGDKFAEGRKDLTNPKAWAK